MKPGRAPAPGETTTSGSIGIASCAVRRAVGYLEFTRSGGVANILVHRTMIGHYHPRTEADGPTGAGAPTNRDDMEHSIEKFCDWLSQTPISLWIQGVSWVIPAVQSVHILAITVVVGAVLMTDMKLLNIAGHGMTVSAMTKRFLPWMWVALIVLLVSGTILITAEPKRDLTNNIFRLKMILLIVAVTITAAFQEVIRRNADAWGETPSKRWSARVIAVTTLAIWIGIIMCGRWIAYADHS